MNKILEDLPLKQEPLKINFVRMKDIFLYSIFITVILLQSCFESDQKMPPKPPGEETDIAIQNSIYEQQIYFDFSTGEIKAEIPNDSWVLAFNATSDGPGRSILIQETFMLWPPQE